MLGAAQAHRACLAEPADVVHALPHSCLVQGPCITGQLRQALQLVGGSVPAPQAAQAGALDPVAEAIRSFGEGDGPHRAGECAGQATQDSALEINLGGAPGHEPVHSGGPGECAGRGEDGESFPAPHAVVQGHRADHPDRAVPQGGGLRFREIGLLAFQTAHHLPTAHPGQNRHDDQRHAGIHPEHRTTLTVARQDLTVESHNPSMPHHRLLLQA